MTFYTKKQNGGFTLIELLVVVSIIGVLSSIVMTNLNSARAKARDAVRKIDLKQLQTALILYQDSYGVYPSTSGAYWGVNGPAPNTQTSGANAYIPGLTPTYISVLPVDPSKPTDPWFGYLYRSDGTNYKLLSWGAKSNQGSGQSFHDPAREYEEGVFDTFVWMLCSGDPTACNTW